jgi:hypothetical protein
MLMKICKNFPKKISRKNDKICRKKILCSIGICLRCFLSQKKNCLLLQKAFSYYCRRNFLHLLNYYSSSWCKIRTFVVFFSLFPTKGTFSCFDDALRRERVFFFCVTTHLLLLDKDEEVFKKRLMNHGLVFQDHTLETT